MAKKKAGRKKKISLTEFKAWLEGVEELQPDTWAPNKDQWELIRNKMDSIVADEPVAVAAAAPAQVRPAVQGGRPPVAGSAMENGVTMAPAIPSSIPAQAPENAQQFATDTGASKTPDLDAGDYSSSFGA